MIHTVTVVLLSLGLHTSFFQESINPEFSLSKKGGQEAGCMNGELPNMEQG